jgi:hypothetical protein
MGVQKHYKKRCTKSRRKEITKKNDQKSKTDFSRFFYHVFGRYSVRGVQKHHTKCREKKNLTLVLLWPLTYLAGSLPTYIPSGVPFFLLAVWRPLVKNPLGESRATPMPPQPFRPRPPASGFWLRLHLFGLGLGPARTAHSPGAPQKKWDPRRYVCR